MKTQTQTIPGRKSPMPDWLFVLWAGGTALLSYSLVYALRKPFTAAEFEGLQVYGMDYKIAVSIIQLLGYVSAKLLGIKYISELRPEGRLKFIIGSAALSELSLIAFGLLPIPYNIVALYFNGLSLGCMWGVIFSFLEGRRTTDILASIMGVSMALSSGVAKSLGLYALNQLHVSEFWMPALSEPQLSLCFASWAFAQIDSIATFVLLAVFALLATTYNHLKVLCMLLMLSTVGMGTLAFLGATEGNETIPTTIWLFLQSLCLDIAYLSFQTIFFERFIACFKIKGNVGFFIITIDFVGYLGTLGLLLFKEFCASHIDWTSFYNHMSLYIGVACCFAFIASLVYMIHVRNRKQGPLPEKAEEAEIEETEKENTIYLTTTAI